MKRKIFIRIIIGSFLLFPLSAEAGIFDLIGKIFNNGVSQIGSFLHMSYLVKEYAGEQAKMAKLVPKAQLVYHQNLIWFSSGESKVLKKMLDNIQADVTRCEKSDAEYLQSLLTIKVLPGEELNSGDQANINEYLNNAWTRLKKYRFHLESYCTYVECVAQRKKILLKRVQYAQYRRQAIKELNDIYQQEE